MTASTNAHWTVHTLAVDAPVSVLYDLVSDVTVWPAIFGPSVYARPLAHGPGWERFHLWALVNGEVRQWTSRREFDPVRRTITFQQEHSQPPIAAMGGSWSFRPLPDDRTEIVLAHDFVTDGSPGAAEWINAALDRNSAEELSALAHVADSTTSAEEVVFSFTDTVHFPGDAAAAYEFLFRADLWAQRLPHVAQVRLDERPGGVQVLAMSTRTADGATHETRSVRVCQPGEWIAYKQQLTPALLHGHSGVWTVQQESAGALVSSRHTVALDRERVATVLGPGTSLAEARDQVRLTLGRNSRATMEFAADHVRRQRA